MSSTGDCDGLRRWHGTPRSISGRPVSGGLASRLVRYFAIVTPAGALTTPTSAGSYRDRRVPANVATSRRVLATNGSCGRPLELPANPVSGVPKLSAGGPSECRSYALALPWPTLPVPVDVGTISESPLPEVSAFRPTWHASMRRHSARGTRFGAAASCRRDERTGRRRGR